MTRLVVDGRECADTWEHLPGNDAPSGGDFTVSVARWREQRCDLLAHIERTGRRLGIRLSIDTDPATLIDDARHFALIVIEIQNAADGRFFSIAARLREQLHYRGELRVTGEVAPDQLSFMQRCGVNAFELGDHVDIDHFIRRYQRFYQSSGPLTTRDNLIRLARRRRGRPGERLRPESAEHPAAASARPGSNPGR